MQIKSFYVPPYTLNGDEFPVHVIFEDSNSAYITVKYDKELTIKEIYNVPKDGYKLISDQELQVSDFEVNGYLGLVLVSEIGSEANKQCNIVLEMCEHEQRIIQQKNIQIFRPLLKVVSIPSQISVSYDGSKKKYNVSDKIVLKNVGLGSAIVNMKVNERGAAKIGMPENIREFLEGFMSDLTVQISALKIHYPETSPIIDDFFRFFGHPELIIEETNKDGVKAILERFVEALKNNEDLANEFAEAVVSSYLKNIQLITEISSFLEYLHSTAEGKVILTNPVEVLSAEIGMFETGFNLGITDLALNGYPELFINNINFEFKGIKSVPLYMLFDWQTDSILIPRGDPNY